MERNLYLKRISVEDALQNLFSTIRLAPLSSENVDLRSAIGRVLAVPVFSANPAPAFNASAMDGIAVRAKDTIAARENSPVLLELNKQALWVNTGYPIPEGFDAVIMVEYVEVVSESVVAIREPAAPYSNVRPAGEDFSKAELLLPENHKIRPVDLGVLAAAGIARVNVRKKPIITIIPTGDELRHPGDAVSYGGVFESNSFVVAAQLESYGAEAIVTEIVNDDFDYIKKAVITAAKQSDAVVVIAGSSAGSKDMTVKVFSDLGDVKVHGVKIKPGKPVIIASVGDGVPAIGLPGYPVACFYNTDLFLKPLISKLLNCSIPQRNSVVCRLSRKLASNIGEREMVLVKVGKVDAKMVATPLSRGSGITISLTKADGFILIHETSQGLDAGADAEVFLFNDISRIDKTIVVIGSHDMCIDLLETELKANYPELGISSSHVGSMGGLAALTRGEAHLAGIHLIDDKTGEYNISYADKFLPDGYMLINFVNREQGIIVAPGNPLTIKGIADIAEKEARYINRQKGAGTRQLFDYLLTKEGFLPEHIKNYDREAPTHLAVAAAVASGSADAGLGIKAGADVYGLDFIPVGHERYDFVIPAKYLAADNIQKLLGIIRSPEFKAKINRLEGYDTALTGLVMTQKGI